MSSKKNAAANLPAAPLSNRKVGDLARNAVVAARDEMMAADAAFEQLRKKFPFTTHNTVPPNDDSCVCHLDSICLSTTHRECEIVPTARCPRSPGGLPSFLGQGMLGWVGECLSVCVAGVGK